MSVHFFDTDVAAEVGVNAAILYQNIVHWCQRNAANDDNCFEGKTWTYNSTKAFKTLFPYLTPDQIRRALERLEEVGLIGTGCFNKDPRDRTKWFCVLRQTHLATTPAPFGENASSNIETNINTDINTDNKHHVRDAEFDLEVEKPKAAPVDRFEEFWQAYPVKAGKPAAQKNFTKAVKSGADPDKIIQAAKRYRDWLANAPKGEFRPQPKYPQGWLTDERWNDPELQVESTMVHRSQVKIPGYAFGQAVR